MDLDRVSASAGERGWDKEISAFANIIEWASHPRLIQSVHVWLQDELLRNMGLVAVREAEDDDRLELLAL